MPTVSVAVTRILYRDVSQMHCLTDHIVQINKLHGSLVYVGTLVRLNKKIQIVPPHRFRVCKCTEVAKHAKI